jgi:hypothetical protein
VPCIAFSQGARQSSLPGKNASGALCRALGQNAHGKGGAVRIPVFAVRRRRTAKSAILVVKLVTISKRHTSSKFFYRNYISPTVISLCNKF